MAAAAARELSATRNFLHVQVLQFLDDEDEDGGVGGVLVLFMRMMILLLLMIDDRWQTDQQNPMLCHDHHGKYHLTLFDPVGVDLPPSSSKKEKTSFSNSYISRTN